ncbi:MAG: hypothetical protein LBT27_00880 [Prevotellaceae bacterium]|jgi:hypothetical protein|nr:hypothetical protein [Prevotellaceae bacterium]
MTKKFLFLLAVASSLTFAACSDDDKQVKPTPKPTGDLVVSKTVIDATADSSSYDIVVTSKDKWNAAVDTSAKWCTVAVNSVRGKNTLKVNVTENNAKTKRSAKITVSAGKLTRVITVNQAPEPNYAVVELTATPANGEVKLYAKAKKLKVDWGDGKNNTYTAANAEIKHTYADNKERTIVVKAENLTQFGDKVIADTVNALMVGKIQKINFTSTPDLKAVRIVNNNLAEINLNGATALETLWVYSNNITTLDVSKNAALTNLNCAKNQLKTLDVSKNIALKSMNCNDNQIDSLNASKNAALTNLNCAKNQLKTLDVSKNIALKSMNCNDNQIDSLTVTKNTALTALYCNNNNLVESAINSLFASLPKNPSTKDVYSVSIIGNPGSAAGDKKIATDKGWTVL